MHVEVQRAIRPESHENNSPLFRFLCSRKNSQTRVMSILLSKEKLVRFFGPARFLCLIWDSANGSDPCSHTNRSLKISSFFFKGLLSPSSFRYIKLLLNFLLHYCNCFWIDHFFVSFFQFFVQAYDYTHRIIWRAEIRHPHERLVGIKLPDQTHGIIWTTWYNTDDSCLSPKRRTKSLLTLPYRSRTQRNHGEHHPCSRYAKLFRK